MILQIHGHPVDIDRFGEHEIFLDVEDELDVGGKPGPGRLDSGRETTPQRMADDLETVRPAARAGPARVVHDPHMGERIGEPLPRRAEHLIQIGPSAVGDDDHGDAHDDTGISTWNTTVPYRFSPNAVVP